MTRRGTYDSFVRTLRAASDQDVGDAFLAVEKEARRRGMLGAVDFGSRNGNLPAKFERFRAAFIDWLRDPT